MKINVENWRKLRESVANETGESVGFNMNTYMDWRAGGCGTVACLAGHAVINEQGIEAARCLYFAHDFDLSLEAAELLGLGDDMADHRHVFHGRWLAPRGGGLRQVRQADALAYIDKVLETGNPLVII